MKIKFTKNAAEDISYWKKKNKNIYVRIKLLLDDISIDPFKGIGKPEPLLYNLTGKWCRRITSEHRIVYEVVNHSIIVYQCRFHY